MIFEAVNRFDWVGAWEESSIVLTGAFGIIGLATDFRNKHTKKITLWGWVSFLGIVISSVGGMAAQRQKDREDLENLNRAIATFENTAEIVKNTAETVNNTAETVNNTAETVKSINRYGATLRDATVTVKYDLDCVHDPSPCGTAAQIEEALRAGQLDIKLFADRQNADKYINHGLGNGDLEWDLSLTPSNPSMIVSDQPGAFTLLLFDFKATTLGAPTGKVLSLLDLPDATAVVQGYGRSLGIPVERFGISIADGRQFGTKECHKAIRHGSLVPRLGVYRCTFPK